MHHETLIIQKLYPQIYFACHTQHVRASSSEVTISARDSSLLAHLDEHIPMRLTQLAEHLNISISTASEAINKLVELGYILRQKHFNDKRICELRLSPKGSQAMQAASALDTKRVTILLSYLTQEQKTMAIQGLTLLVNAANQMMCAYDNSTQVTNSKEILQ